MKKAFVVILCLWGSFTAGLAVAGVMNFLLKVEEEKSKITRPEPKQRKLYGRELFARNKAGEIVYFGEPIEHPEFRRQ